MKAAPLGRLGQGTKWLVPPDDHGNVSLNKQQLSDSTNYTRPERVSRETWLDGKWVKSECEMQIAKGPFQRGYTRTCYRAKEVTAGGDVVKYCVKVLDPRVLQGIIGSVTDNMYYNDAKCTFLAEDLAKAFNDTAPLQKIEYNSCFLMRLLERPGKPLVYVEFLVEGKKFLKHNNNNGAVLSSRMTPQAYSHFTHHFSRGRMLVCDIQGWENTFTDPQVHTADGKGFGLGNQGRKGIKKFFASHTCGVVCGLLGMQRMSKGKVMRAGWAKADLIASLKKMNLPIPKHLGGEDKENSAPAVSEHEVEEVSTPVEKSVGTPEPEDLDRSATPALFEGMCMGADSESGQEDEYEDGSGEEEDDEEGEVVEVGPLEAGGLVMPTARRPPSDALIQGYQQEIAALRECSKLREQEAERLRRALEAERRRHAAEVTSLREQFKELKDAVLKHEQTHAQEVGRLRVSLAAKDGKMEATLC